MNTGLKNKFSNDIDAILSAQHFEPYSFLGLHKSTKSDYLTLRIFQPNAKAVSIVDPKTKRTINKLVPVGDTGIFAIVTRRKKPFKYMLKIIDSDGEKFIYDSFSFSLVLGELDVYLLAEGNHKKPYSKLGAHCIELDGVKGVSFAVWAPNASYVSVVGDFNQWDGRCHPLRLRHECGVWEIFIPQLSEESRYKYEIKNNNGQLLPLKSDPYAFQSEYRPDTASEIVNEIDYRWNDQQWLSNRGERNARNKPICIYEVHLGSWKRKGDNEYLNYRELAEQLVDYAKEMSFTHLQLMPVSEFPYDGSWGYQPVGLFAPTSRFKSDDSNVIEDFKYFVDQCHQNNIGLLIDWVPGHFPEDKHGLAQFDGTHLYEHQDKEKGFHPDWNTLIYNYGRTEVANFLRASANHWLDRFHVDGIRVDAVASMLYLDYSRKEDEWKPNKFGGNENLEAVEFLKRFNEELYSDYPGTISIAEESTSWPGVSRPTSDGGLGFGYKWNMGWMNDSLEYMKRDPIHRKYHQGDLSFSLVYAFDENFILPLSHDEVVHGKGSILTRMPGDEWQQFANVRAYYGFMWGHPGKKLLFMGCEFAQRAEWNFERSLDWNLLENKNHSGIKDMVADLNRIYVSTPALYENDCESQGFEWIDHENSEYSIFSFIRYGYDRKKPIIVISNFTPQVHHRYKIGVPLAGRYKEIFNSDAGIYGGSNQGNLGDVLSDNLPHNGYPNSLSISVPPLSTMMFEVVA